MEGKMKEVFKNIKIKQELKARLDLLVERKGQTYNDIIEKLYTFHKIRTEDSKARVMSCPKCGRSLVTDGEGSNTIKCVKCDEYFCREELEEYSYLFRGRK